MMASRHEPKRIADVLSGVLKKMGLQDKIADLQLGPLWQQVVGSAVGLHTRALGLKNGCLFVVVDTPIWKTELERYYKNTIIPKLKAKDPRIKRLSFQIGEIASTPMRAEGIKK